MVSSSVRLERMALHPFQRRGTENVTTKAAFSNDSEYPHVYERMCAMSSTAVSSQYVFVIVGQQVHMMPIQHVVLR